MTPSTTLLTDEAMTGPVPESFTAAEVLAIVRGIAAMDDPSRATCRPDARRVKRAVLRAQDLLAAVRQATDPVDDGLALAEAWLGAASILLPPDPPRGEALPGLPLVLSLPRAATYDIEAELTARQSDSASTSAWTLQATYGSLGSGNDNFNTPAQVAVDATHVYVADSANNRMVKRLLSTGAYVSSITGLNGITGVAVDGSGNVYVAGNQGIGAIDLVKYNASFVQQWITGLSNPAGHHVATDGIHVFVTEPGSHLVRKRLASTGAGGAPATFGSAGSGDGQFNTPRGIAVGGSEVYVVDAGNSRVQVFSTAGAYQRQWPISANARGIALDASGDVLVAEYGSDLVKRYTNVGVFIDQFSQTDPDGIAVASGDVPWVSNATDDTLVKWDEAVSGGGHGQVAIEIDGVLSPYLGIGLRNGAVGNVAVGTKAGPGTVLIRAFGKATAGTLTLRSVVLSARATPRS